MTDSSTDDLWQIHQYLREFVQFADAKAGAVILWSGAVIGWLVSKDALNLVSRKGFDPQIVRTWFAVVSLLCLGLAFVWCIRVIAPILDGHASQPPKAKCARGGDAVIYWKSILSHSRNEYLTSLGADEGMSQKVASHIYSLASIANAKYAKITTAVWLAGFGSLFAVLFIWTK